MATAIFLFLATLSVVYCAPAPTFIGYAAPPLFIPASHNVISVSDTSEVKNATSGSVVVEDVGHNYLNSLPTVENENNLSLYPGFISAPPAISTTIVESVPSLYPFPPLIHGGTVVGTTTVEDKKTDSESIVPFLPIGTPGGAVLGKPSGISTTVVEESKPETEGEKSEAEEEKSEAEEEKSEAEEEKSEAEEDKSETEGGKQSVDVKPVFVSQPIIPYLPNNAPGGAVLGTPSGISTTIVEEPKPLENKSVVFGTVPTYISPFGHPSPVTFFAPPLIVAPVVGYPEPPVEASTPSEETTETSDDGSYKETKDDESATEKVDDDGLYKGDESSTETTETSDAKTESTPKLKTVVIHSPAIVPVFPAHYFRPPSIFIETEARGW